MTTSTGSLRKHFKIGSRKSKLAMVQTEYIAGKMKELFPDCTFEIVNFDTKGDQILSIALPKIGDKGLFTKELEDALGNKSIDFVVHSLKDMPCQEMPEGLIISGVPKREDPRDALVVAKRWQGIKFSLDDLGENSVVGTSSLRRISQLTKKYPMLKFETIRGNLQTRFSKLDDQVEKKFDAIILAAAGLKRMKYEDRITQLLPPEICMHAVSQGALGIECWHDDKLMIQMINRLNDEETLLQCIAERTFLAKMEGGCSAPVGIFCKVTSESILLEGCVIDIDGSRKIQDKFEMSFSNSLEDCPIMGKREENKSLKRRLSDNDDNEESVQGESANKRVKPTTADKESEQFGKCYSFIVDYNIDQQKMLRAELCGLHLAEKIKEQGGDVLVAEIKAKVLKSNF